MRAPEAVLAGLVISGCAVAPSSGARSRDASGVARHEVGARPSLYPYTREMPVMIDKTLEQPANKTDEYIYWPG